MENISTRPNLVFRKNRARSILVTAGGKVVTEDITEEPTIDLTPSTSGTCFGGAGMRSMVDWIFDCKELAFCGRPQKEPMGRAGGRGNGG